jgi:DNA primase
MPHPQTRMPALLDVARGASETKDQKIAQTLFGALQIAGRVHGTQNVIAGNAPVERGDQPAESFLANQRVNFLTVNHGNPGTIDNGTEPSRMDVAQQIKAQLDIVRVISDYVPRLRRFGNRYSCLCPFHNEKTPSFSVYADHQFYKCYGCDAKGDVFNFVMAMDNISFWEALKKLAEQNGIPLPKQSQAVDDKTRLRGAIREMHEIAVDHFRANLAGPNGAEVRGYLKERGVTQSSAQLFQIGLSDGGGRTLLHLLERRGFKPDQMVESGLIARREDGSLYDRFRNRLMFPIHDESGKVIAFGGRALDPESKAKYLNSPETEIYKKSNVLYNLHRAKQGAAKTDRMVMVEGYMDVIGATQAGIAEVVAPCGTALTTEQIRAMKRHSANLHLNFDPDAAGDKAAERSIKLLLDENVRIRVVELEGGLDPDEFCKEHGRELYRERIANAKPYFYWLADRARQRFDMRDPQGRNDIFKFLLPAIQGLRDKIERVSVANDLASYLGIESGLVLEHFRKMAADRTEHTPTMPKADPAKATDRILLVLLLNDESVRQELLDALRELPGWRQSPTAPIYETLITMHDANVAISFNALHERLAPADQEKLASIVLVAAGGSVTAEDGTACIDKMRRDDRETIARDLKARIKIAEREGRISDAFELMRTLSEHA